MPEAERAAGAEAAEAGAGRAAAADRHEPRASTVWRPPWPVDLRLTLMPLARGPSGGPTFRLDADGTVWLTARTPLGAATLALRTAGGEVHADGWGSGAEWLVSGVPELLGAGDDMSGFAPAHPLLRDLARRYPGLRMARTRLVWDALVPAVLEQKVAASEAWRSYRELLWRFGAPAPGPAPRGMRVMPAPTVLHGLPQWEWHRAGVDQKRRRTLRAAATVAGRLGEAVGMGGAAAAARLRVVPGIGPWTAAEVVQRALGDADAVSVGDYNFPSLVGWSLCGVALDDAGMLAVLEEYRPHRHRVVRLLELGGRIPPRRAPRARIRDFRSW